MVYRIARFGILLIVSWIVMTFTHESGHMVGGFVGGARLTDFEVAPWRLPYSLHSPDPHPLLTLWAGPVLGIAVPGLMAMVLRYSWTRFIADFCLLANGLYLALSGVAGDRLLDTPRLLDAGASPIGIVAFCALTIGVGYVRFRGDCVAVLSGGRHGKMAGRPSAEVKCETEKSSKIP